MNNRHFRTNANCKISLAALALLLALPLTAWSQLTTLLNNWNGESVSSGPTETTTFTIAQPYYVTVVSDYHFYNGGVLPGTISLRHSDGTLYGPWNAVSGEAVWGVSNSVWVATPSVIIKPGVYTVIDSDNATWSYNFGGGFSAVYGLIQTPPTATASAVLVNNFLVGVTIIDGGSGYTNTPTVRIFGGGGSGAQAMAVVTNGVVIAINILDAGSGYTSTPIIVIAPAFIEQPLMDIAAMSLLSFTNLEMGSNYQFQSLLLGNWTDTGPAFTAASLTFTQSVSGVASADSYRLAATPVPSQAHGTAQVVNGFVVGATVSSGGSGYTSDPVVSVTGGGGTNATAIAVVQAAVVTGITITSAGIGYTDTPAIVIAAPPATALWPNVTQVMRLDLSGLSPYDSYQLEFSRVVPGTWSSFSPAFTPTALTNTQSIVVPGEAGFFRVRYAR